MLYTILPRSEIYTENNGCRIIYRTEIVPTGALYYELCTFRTFSLSDKECYMYQRISPFRTAVKGLIHIKKKLCSVMLTGFAWISTEYPNECCDIITFLLLPMTVSPSYRHFMLNRALYSLAP